MVTQWADIDRRVHFVTHRVSTTPGLLKSALAAVWALAFLFFLLVAAGVKEHRQGMQTIGKDSAPSIIAAQSIRASLSDMHSNAANQLLVKPADGVQFAKDYETRRLEATRGLLDAAGNITYGEAEKVPLRTLIDQLGKYEAAVAQALILHERGDGASLMKLRDADKIMHEALLPAADDLDKANRSALDAGYRDVRTSSGWALARVVLAGLALIAGLVALQVFLYRRTHRILNPALVAATLLAGVFLIHTTMAFLAESTALKVAKQDAFESIHTLWRARSVAYDANGEESRWLLDRAEAPKHQERFFAQSSRLVTLPKGQSYDQLLAVVRKSPDHLPDGFQGYLAAELRNITFAGEFDAAFETLKTFGKYVELDGEIRRLEDAGKHAEAVALCLSYEPGQSNWAFFQFDAALGKTLEINMNAFKQAVDRGFQELAGFELWNPIVALGVSALAFAGLRPRLREYIV